MKKKAVSIVMLQLLLLITLTLAFNIQPVKTEPKTIIVPDDYPTIQEAINNAIIGDTIFVEEGTYYENVIVNKTVSLVGEDKHSTIIDGNLIGNALLLEADRIIVMGFSVRRSGSNSGILVEFRNCNNTVADCVVSGNEYGIYLDTESSNNKIINNLVSNNYPYGIFIRRSFNNDVANNTLSLNDDGIYLYQSWNNSIMGNVLTNNSAGILLGKQETSGNLITDNHVTNNSDVGIRLHGGSQDNLIYHNSFSNNTNQASIGFPLDSNIWDDGYPSGGNYWSDYEKSYPDAEEIDDSGIWDTPYVIDENNQDRYPLMEPWTPLPRTIDELKTEIEQLGSEDEIDNKGIVKSLIAKLNVAQKLVNKEKIDEAKSILEEDFIPQVENLTDIHISKEAADILIESAEYIISQL